MTIDPGFTTPEMARVFSPESRIALMCRFESELAAAQAEMGIVPPDAAEAIAQACSIPIDDPEAVLRAAWEAGTPVLVLLEELRARLSDDHAAWIHHGATTQDVVDTALMLQSRTGLEILEHTLAAASGRLADLADAHRGTAALGRTFLQPALTISFGSRVGRWLDPLVAVRRDSRRLRADLPVQLGGPVGDMASYGDGAIDLAGRVATGLDLAAARPWHTDRWPIQQIASLLVRSASSCSKIVSDVAALAASGEVRVRSGGSSAMSHKQNPLDAMRAEAAAQVCRVVTAGLIAAPSQVLERGMGPWHAEWALVPLAFQTAGAAAEATARCLDTLEVDTEAMEATAGGESPADTGLIDRVLAAHRELDE